MALPAKVLAVADRARHLVCVDCMGQTQTVNAAGVLARGGALDALIGSWVLLHQGFAMDRMTADEAAETLAALGSLSDPARPLDVSEMERRQTCRDGDQ